MEKKPVRKVAKTASYIEKTTKKASKTANKAPKTAPVDKTQTPLEDVLLELKTQVAKQLEEISKGENPNKGLIINSGSKVYSLLDIAEAIQRGTTAQINQGRG